MSVETFQSFREKVSEYLNKSSELKSFRVVQIGKIVKVYLTMKVESYVSCKLSEDVEFFKPIADTYLSMYQDWTLENFRIEIFCEKEKENVR